MILDRRMLMKTAMIGLGASALPGGAFAIEAIGKAPRGKTCDAIEGILAEGDEIMEEYKDTPALDAGLLAAAQVPEREPLGQTRTA